MSEAQTTLGTPDADVEQGGPSGTPPSGPNLALFLLAAAVTVTLAPFVVVVFRAALSGWTPSGDQAMEILRMHDVGSANTPLLGPYSRFGWDHPGPLLFWLGAVGLRLGGPPGVMVLVGLINIGAVIGTVAAARRLAGDLFALVVTAAVAVMVSSHGAVKLIDPWNPWVTVLPLLCYLLCVPVAVARRSRWALVVAIGSGSFAAQSHLGNVPVVLAAAVVGSIWWWVWERPERRRPVPGQIAHRRALWVPALLVILWSGPLIDLVINAPGNLWALTEFAMGSTEEPAPLADALGAAARELGLLPAWLGANEGVWPVAAAPIWTLLVLPAALVAGLLAARRNRDLHPVRAEGIVAYALAVYAAAAFAVTRTTGGLIPYVLRWTWPAAMLATVVALLPLLQLLGRRAGRERTGAGTVGAGVVAALATLTVLVASVSSVGEGRRHPVEPSPHTDRSVGPLSAAIREVLPVGDYGLEWLDVRSFSATSIGTGADLTRHGYGIDFPRDHASRVGEFRATGRTDVPTLQIVGQTPARVFSPPDGARLIVEWDHLSARERARADELEARIRLDAAFDPTTLMAVDTRAARENLVAMGADPADVLALHRLEGDRESYDVWLVPPGAVRT